MSAEWDPEPYADSAGFASVVQRARGVYLANVSESKDGLEAWEAFATAAAAKRWCAHWHDRKRLAWEHTPAIPGKRWAAWLWSGEAAP